MVQQQILQQFEEYKFRVLQEAKIRSQRIKYMIQRDYDKLEVLTKPKEEAKQEDAPAE